MTPYRGRTLRYDVDRALLPARLAERVVELELDAAAREFIDAAIARPHGRALYAAHRCLRPFLSDFEINGLLGTHPLHLLSTEQWQRLLGAGRRASLLDVGAGGGEVTARLAPLFERVQTIETAWAMARRLRQRGYGCWRIDATSAELPESGFDVIACLNVVDRCDAPRTLLAALGRALAPGGCLLLATPLPLAPFVYDAGATREPRQRLDCRSREWECAAAELAENELSALGLSVQSLSRAPYLSRGWARHPVCMLDDAIFVCTRS